MRLFQKEIKKRIGPYMKQQGFRLHNRTYSYLSNHIALCVSFEQPGGMMYTYVHVNPLYIPQDCVYFSYGNRLNNIAAFKLPPLSETHTPTDLDNWCEMFIRCMNSHVLPFFGQVDSPEKLLAYAEHPVRTASDSIICAAPWLIEKLKLYTHLYLGNLPAAWNIIASYQNTLQYTPLVPSLRDKFHQDAKKLGSLISSGDAAVRDFCRQTIVNTTQLFIKFT